MKKWLLIGLTFLFSLSGFSQIVDTLGIIEYRNGTPTLYTSPNGGFAFGNNGYNDRVKAQTFQVENPVTLTEVLIEFGAVIYSSANPESVVNVNIYDNYGSGILVGSETPQDSVAPDSILASITIPVSQLVDDGSFSIADFSLTPIIVGNNFSIGLDLTQLAAEDSVGLVSTTDGDASGNNNAWELTSDSVWFQVAESAYSWGLEVQLAIFAVVEIDAPASVVEQTIAASLYPNPCSEYLNLSLLAQGTYNVELIDGTGRVVLSASVKGSNNMLDLSHLESGLYIVSISDKSVRSTYTVIKE